MFLDIMVSIPPLGILLVVENDFGDDRCLDLAVPLTVAEDNDALAL